VRFLLVFFSCPFGTKSEIRKRVPCPKVLCCVCVCLLSIEYYYVFLRFFCEYNPVDRRNFFFRPSLMTALRLVQILRTCKTPTTDEYYTHTMSSCLFYPLLRNAAYSQHHPPTHHQILLVSTERIYEVHDKQRVFCCVTTKMTGVKEGRASLIYKFGNFFT